MIASGRYEPIDKRRWPLTWLLSPWMIPALVLIGWGPLFAVDALGKIFPYLNSWNVAEGFGMPWGMGVALPFTVLAVILTAVQIFRLLIDLASRLK